MKFAVWLFALILSAAPAFAQDREETALRELGMGGLFAEGNLAVRDYQRGNDPVQQLKRFFAEAKQPLTSAQEKQLNSIVENQVKAMQASAQNEESTRRLNLEYTKKINDTLTPDQRNSLRRYRTEQIMMRGGFQAVKLILENGQAPFTAEQEIKAQDLYLEFNRKVDQLARDSKGTPDRAQLDKLENEALGQIVRLLTPEQRRALATSRQGTVTSKVRP
jgi:hypothetical protein